MEDGDLNLDLGIPYSDEQETLGERLKRQLYSELAMDLNRENGEYVPYTPPTEIYKKTVAPRSCDFFGVCTVDELVCFLFSTRSAIEGLYSAYARSFNVANGGRSFFYTFSFPGIEGRATYSAKRMQQLDCEGERASICYLCKCLDIDNMARLLFKLKKCITGLYGAVVRATNVRDTARSFFYTFNSPFAGCIKMKGGNRKTYNRDHLLLICCQCERACGIRNR